MKRQVLEADQGECQLSTEVGEVVKLRSVFRAVRDVSCGFWVYATMTVQ